MYYNYICYKIIQYYIISSVRNGLQFSVFSSASQMLLPVTNGCQRHLVQE